MQYFTDYVGDMMRVIFDEVFKDPTLFVSCLRHSTYPSTIPVEGTFKGDCGWPQYLQLQSWGGGEHTIQPDQKTPGVSGVPR